MFDRLMCWTILTKTNRIVRKNINHLHFGQRREPDRRPHVIRESHERSAERNQASVQRNACQRRTHRVFAHAEMNDASIVGAGRETVTRSEEHTSELQSRLHLVCRLLLEKKKNIKN